MPRCRLRVEWAEPRLRRRRARPCGQRDLARPLDERPRAYSPDCRSPLALVPAQQVSNKHFKKPVHLPNGFRILATSLSRKKGGYSVAQNIQRIGSLGERGGQREAHVFKKIETLLQPPFVTLRPPVEVIQNTINHGAQLGRAYRTQLSDVSISRNLLSQSGCYTSAIVDKQTGASLDEHIDLHATVGPPQLIPKELESQGLTGAFRPGRKSFAP